MTVPSELNNFCSSFESRTLRRVAQLQIRPSRISPNLLRRKARADHRNPSLLPNDWKVTLYVSVILYCVSSNPENRR